MTFSEWCELRKIEQKEELQQAFEAGRKSVAEDVALLFNIGIGENEAGNFLRNIKVGA